ncbi:hypothetical protein B0H10DRAFT_692113 [Mycena sp. CBHHK59/15]|nr:hypothetical protein B0H10DRAFT_692113 [Mycena sp. CBHHK59/15]
MSSLEQTESVYDASSLLLSISDSSQSIVRGAILGYVQKAPSSGWSCFRALLDASELPNIPELAWITEGVSGARFVISKEEPFRALFLNLCRNSTLINLVVLYLDSEQDSPNWTQTATREELAQKLAGFHPSFMRVLDLPAEDSFLRWKLLALPELPTWVRGRAAILGDAAHATFPSLGQGAAMAIEEAGILGSLLPVGTKREDIEGRLKGYQTLCKSRADYVSTESVEQTTEPSKRGQYFRSQELQAFILEYDAIQSGREFYREHFGQM